MFTDRVESTWASLLASGFRSRTYTADSGLITRPSTELRLALTLLYWPCNNSLAFFFQDLTITVASELPCTECELIEDKEEHHVVNRQSFVDEQEWHLYVHTECNKKELVIDQVDNSVKRSALSVKCRAARRPGYFVWNIFMITVSICISVFSLGDNRALYQRI